MVAPLHSTYSSRKGIYRDLYREIDSDNKKKDASQVRKPRRGIYVELYKQINFRNREQRNDQSNLYLLAFKKFINDTLSKVSYFFSPASLEVKPLIVACMVAKKPINDYIENNVQNLDIGLCYNDR